MKSTILNIRIDKATRIKLNALSEKTGLNVSESIRDILNKFLNDQSLEEDEIPDYKEGIHLVRSVRFAEFIFWLYAKRYDPFDSELTEFYVQHIELIEECKLYPLFNSELLLEFEKVSLELKGLVYKDSNFGSTFQFASDGEKAFNYETLANFMYTIRYDEFDNKVIHCL